jgi:hypothetical protein
MPEFIDKFAPFLALLFLFVIGIIIFSKKKETPPPANAAVVKEVAPGTAPDPTPNLASNPNSLSLAAGNLDQISQLPDGIKEITFKSTVDWGKINRHLRALKGSEDPDTNLSVGTSIGALRVKLPEHEKFPDREHILFANMIYTSIPSETFAGEISHQKKQWIGPRDTTTNSFVPPSSGGSTEILTSTLDFDELPAPQSEEERIYYKTFVEKLRRAYVPTDDLADNIEISWKVYER